MKLYSFVFPLALGALICGTISPAHAAPAADLGSAEPGLKMIYIRPDKYAICVFPPETVGVGFPFYYWDKIIGVIAQKNFDPAAQHPGPDSGLPLQLYPFDAHSAFTVGTADRKTDPTTSPTKLYTLEGTQLTLGGDAHVIARQRYGLAQNQVFLGRVDNNLFYWELDKPRCVYVRAVGVAAPPGTIVLPRRVHEVLGVLRNASGGVKFVTFGESPGLIHWYPYSNEIFDRPVPAGAAVSGATHRH